MHAPWISLSNSKALTASDHMVGWHSIMSDDVLCLIKHCLLLSLTTLEEHTCTEGEREGGRGEEEGRERERCFDTLLSSALSP